ncbi:MAG: hypothetical protein JXR37_36735 [Kiritimatiellae bacterium]|nr:hypothetical protein [Kiritimatiellia bacterium]
MDWDYTQIAARMVTHATGLLSEEPGNGCRGDRFDHRSSILCETADLARLCVATLATAAEKPGDGEAACRLLRALEQHPLKTATMRIQVAQALTALNRHEEAVGCLAGVEDMPLAPDARLRVCALWIQIGRPGKAVAVLPRVDAPQLPATNRITFAHILLQLGQVEEARQVLEAIDIRSLSGKSELERLAQTALRARMFGLVRMALDRPPLTLGLSRKGDLCRVLLHRCFWQLDDALDCLEAREAARGSSLETLIWGAAFLFTTGRLEHSRDILEAHMKDFDAQPALRGLANYWLALTYRNLGSMAEALKAHAAAVQVGDSAVLWYSCFEYARLLLHLGQPSDALQVARQGMAACPCPENPCHAVVDLVGWIDCERNRKERVVRRWIETACAGISPWLPYQGLVFCWAAAASQGLARELEAREILLQRVLKNNALEPDRRSRLHEWVAGRNLFWDDVFLTRLAEGFHPHMPADQVERELIRAECRRLIAGE